MNSIWCTNYEDSSSNGVEKEGFGGCEGCAALKTTLRTIWLYVSEESEYTEKSEYSNEDNDEEEPKIQQPLPFNETDDTEVIKPTDPCLDASMFLHVGCREGKIETVAKF